MNHRWNVLLCVLSAVLVVGCKSAPNHPGEQVNVIIEGDGDFPVALAGTWKADEHGWEIAFAPDGRILSAVISLGRVRIVPGQTTTLPTRSGGQGVFVPGPWTVHYAPTTELLTVKIAMDHLRVEMAGNVVEGTSTDVFAGPVLPRDGVWQTQWTTVTQYQARPPSGPPVDLSTDPTYGETRPLTFRKALDR